MCSQLICIKVFRASKLVMQRFVLFFIYFLAVLVFVVVAVVVLKNFAVNHKIR